MGDERSYRAVGQKLGKSKTLITVLKLDPETRDLCFDAEGIMDHLEDSEAIAQNIRNNLNTWKGEFKLDTGHGTNWEHVVSKRTSDAEDEADDVLRASIFQEPYNRKSYACGQRPGHRS